VFDLHLPDGGELQVALRVPGEHNALNAAAALAAAVQLGVSPGTAAEALGAFTGIGRRYDVLYEGRGIVIVDDYAHHPTEIEAALAAARAAWPGRIIAVFQPHLFSRTQLLLEGFARAFHQADEVILTEIYAAREDPIPGVTGECLFEAVRAAEPGKPVRFHASQDAIVEDLRRRLAPGDMALTLGAGDIREAGERLAAALADQGN
jgi:UDP-N-acetylmuramate--alanine ligase